VLIADLGEGVNTVWRLTPDGILHRFAGSGIATGSKDGPGGDPADDLNDGQLAVFATLNGPARVVVDAAGNVYISDLGNDRVRRVDAATGRISTVASGLSRPVGLALGAGNDLFIADTGTSRILKGSTTGGTPVAFAGTGTPGSVNDVDSPVAAILAPLNAAAEVAVDSSGVVYIGDTGNNVVHKVTTDGIMHRVAGILGIPGVEDTPVPGFLAHFRSPGVALGPGQTILIPDIDNNRIRRYDLAADVVTTIAGGPNSPGDGGPATAALLDRPTGLAMDGGGAVFVAEHDSHRVRRIDPAGTISTVINAGGLNDSATDGAPAVNSPLRQPTGVAFDAGGHLLVTDAVDHRVLLVDSGGIVRTFAGTARTAGFAGDGGAAASALLNTPLRMAVAQDGSVYIADFNNNRVRKVDPNGIISTVAGGGGELNQPAGLAFDAAGNLYIADFGSNRIFRLDPTGALAVLAGSGTAGSLGDNGQAVSAQLNGPTDVAVAGDGGLFIVDQLNNKVRFVAPAAGGTVAPTSTIWTVLGDGTPGFADGLGVQSRLLFPTGIALDAQGRVLIADRGNQLVRVGTPAPTCAAPTQRCDTAAQCDDGNPCTIDNCEANHLCSNTPLPPGQCHPSCSAEPGACMPGGGPRGVDCLAQTFVVGRAGGPPVVMRCRDNDPACDFDPTPGSCTFRVACCLNEPGCSARTSPASWRGARRRRCCRRSPSSGPRPVPGTRWSSRRPSRRPTRARSSTACRWRCGRTGGGRGSSC
jgi:sugar lactone lactonase YvrE